MAALKLQTVGSPLSGVNVPSCPGYRARLSTEAFKGILRGKSNGSLDKDKAKAKEAKDGERSLPFLGASKLYLEHVL